jgi:hypothetical protein
VSTTTNLQIVIALIDAHMIADFAWRHWLETLARDAFGPLRVVIPIALDSTAFNAPPAVRKRNFLRPSGRIDADEQEEQARAIRSLLRQLTETLSGILLGTAQATAANLAAAAQAPSRRSIQAATGLKLRVFLSHAKADGTTPARRIRDYIYSQTQLAAFYDENDIPFASPFAEVLTADVQTTSALIAIRSARYASRPWCRREVSLFRRPIPMVGLGASERWRLNPMIVVEALEGGATTAGIAELGNTAAIRWDAAVPDQEELIVTTLMRDALLGAFHAAAGLSIADAPDTIVVNWLPDPTTLLAIPRVRDPRNAIVYYPGAMSGLDLDILDELFPHLTFQSFGDTLP